MLKKEKKIEKRKILDRRRRNLQSLSSYRDFQSRSQLTSKRKPYMSSRELHNQKSKEIFENSRSLKLPEGALSSFEIQQSKTDDISILNRSKNNITLDNRNSPRNSRHSRSMSRVSRSPKRNIPNYRHSKFDILQHLEKQEPTLGYKLITCKKLAFKVSMFNLQTGDHLETIDCMPRRDTTVFINLDNDTFLDTSKQVMPEQAKKKSKKSMFTGEIPKSTFENVEDILIKFIIPSTGGKKSESCKILISK